jgi:hypothetical protein
MRKKKRTVTTIEAHQEFVIRRPESALTWCTQCLAKRALMVSPDEAGALIAVSPREIYRRIEAGTVHFNEKPDGGLLVCLNSLHKTPSIESLIDLGERP